MVTTVSSRIFICTLLFFLCTLSLRAQSSIETQLTYSRFEKFHQVGYIHTFNAFELRAGLGYGIVKTFFQKRIFPQIYFGSSYDLLPSNKWMLGPTIYTSFSGFTYNRLSNAKALYLDVLGGLQFFYGEKWKVGMRTVIGFSWEKLTGNRRMPITMNYSGEITVRYAF